MPHAIPIDKMLADGPWSLRRGVPGRCRVWTGFRDRDGYGFCQVDAQPMGAHRLAWVQAHGPIPAGPHVCHACDHRRCCNPDHLFLDSPAGNAADREAKGRGGERAGQANGHARLTSAKVDFIRRRYAVGGISQRRLARIFGVSQAAIFDIVTGRRWPQP